MNKYFDVTNLNQFEFGAIIITVLAAGLVFGCLIAYNLLKRKAVPQQQAAVKIEEEFKEYKEKVDEHFNQTSDMFKDVTTQYKKLYDHMAVGAIELTNSDASNMPRLEMQEIVENEEQTETVEDETPPDSVDTDDSAEDQTDDTTIKTEESVSDEVDNSEITDTDSSETTEENAELDKSTPEDDDLTEVVAQSDEIDVKESDQAKNT